MFLFVQILDFMNTYQMKSCLKLKKGSILILKLKTLMFGVRKQKISNISFAAFLRCVGS